MTQNEKYQCTNTHCRKIWDGAELAAEMTRPYTCPECGQHARILAGSWPGPPRIQPRKD